jgi:Zn-dependent M28 family amino/carboxypeptidase
MRVRSSSTRSATVTIGAFLLMASPSARAQTPASTWSATGPAADRWFGHVEALANDEMRGRETGSPEHRKAAEYVAAQFKAAGLAPGASGGFFQPVSFTSRRLVEDTSSLSLVRDGQETPVTLGEQAIVGMRLDPAPAVDAPLVFAGYGMQVPELGIDDFAGLDVKGKVVVIVVGSQANLAGALSAHHQSAWVRADTLRRLGAIGLVSIPNPRTSDVPWARSSANRLNAAMSLADASLGDAAGQKLAVTFNPAHAERLFEGSGHTFAELLALAETRQALPHFALPTSIRARVTVETRAVESQNVVGLLRGSDATLSSEYVVLTAHLDHLGVGAPINGDAIYNGAMDNASGIATLIEAATAVVAARPKRSVLFVAVTAEEKGLLGSRFFARNPTVPPRASVVANINMDMFLPLYPLQDLMVLGLDDSELGDDVRVVAQAVGIGVVPDPQPLRNRFTRSDQYSFIREGIPAVAMKVGVKLGTPEAELDAAWTRERYHAPSDDLAQPIDRAAAVGFTDVIGRLAVQVANRPARPAWKADSFFRRFARTPATH